ncbi:50S ribosomal protein L11 methyltransferase [Rhabdothermincola sediminis]|uniref:50S ribosomal protein L11 methyltransferase n=1 Tax=Rhabdothermincola sediminis TaxID=2751370 RepID=UPI001AA08036|nr:50S ribosomal protein L11 methyltransferase [Rhabdothermincola sediminis]
MQGWRQVRVEVDATAVDAISGALWGAGVAGIEECPVGSGARCALLAAVPADRLDAVVEAVSEFDPVAADLDPEAGLDTWKRHAHPVEAGPFVVEPAWWAPAATSAAPGVGACGGVGTDLRHLRIDPGRSFGSGSHVTTRLMLEAVGRFTRPGSRVLDVGCGSGVLSVAAAVSGASEVRAVDLDPHAVEATIANARRNGVGARIDCDDASLEHVRGVFDLVLANIGASVLVDLAGPLAARVAPGGRLVLSGMLDEQVDQVAAAHADAFPDGAERRGRDGWGLMVLCRPAPSPSLSGSPVGERG